jgi:hypothetical protein
MLEYIDTSQGQCAKGIEGIQDNEDKEQMRSSLDALKPRILKLNCRHEVAYQVNKPFCPLLYAMNRTVSRT